MSGRAERELRSTLTLPLRLLVAGVLAIGLIVGGLAIWRSLTTKARLMAVDRDTGVVLWDVQLPNGGAPWIWEQDGLLVVPVCRAEHRELHIDPADGRVVASEEYAGYGGAADVGLEGVGILRTDPGSGGFGLPRSGELSFDRTDDRLVSTMGWSLAIDTGGPSWIPAYVDTDAVYIVHHNANCDGFD